MVHKINYAILFYVVNIIILRITDISIIGISGMEFYLNRYL